VFRNDHRASEQATERQRERTGNVLVRMDDIGLPALMQQTKENTRDSHVLESAG
jgi:hypothetical protein